MKKKNIWQILSIIILFLYLFGVMYGQYMLQTECNFQLLTLGLFLLGAALLTFGVRKVAPRIAFKTREDVSRKDVRRCFFITFFALLIILEILYIAYWPGFYDLDTLNQYTQVDSSTYSDWHPVLHTLFTFAFPHYLSGQNYFVKALSYAVQFQILYYAFAIAYLMKSMYAYGCHIAFCIVQFVLAIMLPIMQVYILYPWKDLAMMIFIIVLTGQFINIVGSKGEWLKRPLHIGLLSICIVMASFMRHNAILFTAPFVLGLVIYYFRKYKVSIIIMLVICIGLTAEIKGPLYSSLNVEKPGQRVTETTGICMAIMGNALVKNPDAMTPEIRDYLYNVSPKQTWEDFYRLGDFNFVKFTQSDVNLIEGMGYKNNICYTLQTIKDCPRETMTAFLALTGIVWKLGGQTFLQISPGANYFDISYLKITHISPYFRTITDAYLNLWENSFLQWLYKYIGWYSLLLIVLCFGKIKGLKDVQKVFYILPFMCYNFGTALFLTGYDWRYFIFVYPIFIPLAFLLTRKKDADEE